MASIALMVSLALLGGACGNDRTQAAPGQGATDEESPTPATSDVLDAIVLSESEPPTGTEFLEEGTLKGVAAVTHAIEDVEVMAAVEEGFVDGLIRGFITPSLLEAAENGSLDEYAKNFERSGHLVLASWAFAYEDERSAQTALQSFLGYHQESSRMKEAESLDLGDGGSRLHGRPAYADGMPTFMYWWRSGPIVMGINSNGSVVADADEIHAIAEGMQARAEAFVA